jgi:outer membrane protein
MKNFHCLLFSLFLLVLPKLGQTQTPMTLANCVQQGLSNSLTAQRNRLDINKADEKSKEARAAWLPQISGSAAINDNLKLATQILPGAIFGKPGEDVAVQFGTKYTMNGGLDVNQVIYNSAISLNIRAAEMGKKTGELNARKTEEQLMYDIASAYYSAQVSKVQMGIIEANRDRIKKLVAVTKVQFENGFAKKTDYSRLIVNQTNLETDLQNLDINYRQQLTLLKYYMGIPLSTDIVLTEKTDTELLPNSGISMADVTKNSTDFQLIQVQKSMNGLQIEQIKAGYKPTISTGLRLNYQTQQNSLNIFGKDSKWLPTAALAVNLSVPIFDGFSKKHKANQVKIEMEQLRIDEQNLTQSLTLQNDNARYKLQLNQAAVSTQKNNMSLAEEVYQTTQVQFEGGIVPLSELLNAENTLKEAQTNFLKNLVQVKVAELDILKSSGNIREILK